MGLTNLATQGSLTDFQPDSTDIKARRCARMKHWRVISIEQRLTTETRDFLREVLIFICNIPTHTGAGVVFAQCFLPPWKPANHLLVDAGWTCYTLHHRTTAPRAKSKNSVALAPWRSSLAIFSPFLQPQSTVHSWHKPLNMQDSSQCSRCPI